MHYETGNHDHWGRVLKGEPFDNVIWYWAPGRAVDGKWIQENVATKKVPSYPSKAEAEQHKVEGQYLFWVEVK